MRTCQHLIWRGTAFRSHVMNEIVHDVDCNSYSDDRTHYVAYDRTYSSVWIVYELCESVEWRESGNANRKSVSRHMIATGSGVPLWSVVSEKDSCRLMDPIGGAVLIVEMNRKQRPCVSRSINV